jgi:hypothetical protein
MSISGALSFAEDMANAADVLLSENTKPIYAVTITNDQIAYNDTSASRVVSKERITIADGYRPFVSQQETPFDGYLYPCVRQLSPSEVRVLSNGQLSENMFLIGPILFPYTLGSFSGGLDPLATFQPTIGSNNNLQMYVQIFGVGLPNTTNYFSVKEIVLTGKGIHPGLSYKVLVESANINVPS